VLTYLLDDAAPVLLDTYGALPARQDLRDPFFAGLDEVFPQGVNWDAALAGLDFPDVPSHESNMPNFFEAEIVIDAWEDRLWTELPMDVAAAAEELRVALDPVFAGAPAPTVPGTEPEGSAPAGTEPAGTEPATTSG
jgi:multiple sugar transport system substrate-binding protein